MNLYLVKLDSCGSCIKANSYVVVAESENDALYGSAVRVQLDEYLTDRSKWCHPEDEAEMPKKIMTTLIEYELPLTREEADRCSYLKGRALRNYTITRLAECVVGYENGTVLCCDYYPG